MNQELQDFQEQIENPWEWWKQPKTPRKIDFCIYTPGEPDYYGQFNSAKDLFEYLKLAVPGFEPHKSIDTKFSSEYRALYHVGAITICVSGI